MAAPRAKKDTTLSKLVAEEKKNVPKAIKVLCPKSEEWPRPSPEVQEAILEKLTECLSKSGVNIFASGKKDDSVDTTTKQNIRSQLTIGVNSVFRSLEKRRLAGVLVSGQATPAMSVNHVIGMAQEIGCPLLVLDQLGPAIAKATSSKTAPLALGFQQPSSEGSCVFSEVVSLIKCHTSVKTPDAKQLPPPAPLEVKPTIGKDSLWPLRFDSASEKEIVEILIRIFADAPKQSAGKDEQKKKKKKKKRHCIAPSSYSKSFIHQFEMTKRTVMRILEMGKLQMVFVSAHLKTILASESSTSRSSSLLRMAASKKCPVFCVEGLDNCLLPHFERKIFFLGIKKFTALDDPSVKHFEPLVDKIKENLAHCKLVPCAPSAGAEKATIEKCSDPDIKKSVKTDESGGDSEDDSEEEDYSYLYIMKKDSKKLSERLQKEKTEAANSQKDLNFASDFISLTGSLDSSSKKTDAYSSKDKQISGSRGSSCTTNSLSNSKGTLSSPKKYLSAKFTPYTNESSLNTNVTNSADVMMETVKEKDAECVEFSRIGQEKEVLISEKNISPSGDKTVHPEEKRSVVKTDNFLAFSTEVTMKNKEGFVSEKKIASSGNKTADPEEKRLFASTSEPKVTMNDESKVEKKDDNFLSFSVSKTGETMSPKSLDVLNKSSKGGDIEMKSDGPQLFSLDRAGWKSLTKQAVKQVGGVTHSTPLDNVFQTGQEASKKAVKRKMETDHYAGMSILGDLATPESSRQDETLSLPLPAKSKKSKKSAQAVKKQLESDSSFISLSYTPTNIHTLVNNVHKKKKKKKKK